MARKNVSTVQDDELDVRASEAPASGRDYDDSPLDARLLDLDDEQESPFLRGQKRVPVRRGPLPRKTADRIKIILLLLLAVGVAGLVLVTLYRYGATSWRFRIDSGENIEMVGTRNVPRSQVMEVFGSDIDRNIFFVPLGDRKRQLEEMPWIDSATVMRLYPNRLRVIVKERTPIAFVNINSRIALIDGKGVIMDMPMGQQGSYSFPVIVGISDTEPLSTRSAQMKIYKELIRQLDSDGAQYSKDLSDVDLSDPQDLKATFSDPHGAVLLHLGTSLPGGTEFLERFKVYVAHIQEWRTQFPGLHSVDLRYDQQIIMNPDVSGEQQAAPAPAAPATGKNSAANHKTKAKKH